MKSTTYSCQDGTEFTVDWPTEEMSQVPWRWDQLHCPQPLTPLSEDLNEDFQFGFRQAFDRSGMPSYPRFLVAHGYSYTRAEAFGDDPGIRAAIAELDRSKRVDRILEIWEMEYRPEVEALTRALRSFDSPDATLVSLVEQLEQVEAIRRRLGELHMLVMGPSNAASGRFIEFCNRTFGEGGQQLAMEAMGGVVNKSTETGVALWNLSREAAARPEVAALLRVSTPSEFHASILQTPGGDSFSQLLAAFLDEYGMRNETFTELSNPTWQEDPSFALFMIRSYLDLDEDSSPTALHKRTVARQRERTEEARRRLNDDPKKLARFEEWQRAAQQHTVLLENHNFYIDQRAASSARVPCHAIADRLVERGSLGDREDVFYLHNQEIRDTAAGSTIDLKELVAQRRADRDHWTRTVPPTFIGEGEEAANPQRDGFFGPASMEPAGPGSIRGVAASPGIVRGTARVILSLSDVDRLRPGEILVTASTAPPWTPLFAVAGGVVTDAGGVLSHCAVVAREYSIPAVVGSRQATTRIPDGSLITVDGDAGTVTIHD